MFCIDEAAVVKHRFSCVMILPTVRILLHIGSECGAADIRDIMTSDISMNHVISKEGEEESTNITRRQHTVWFGLSQ
jgi:hypothetical protein